MTEYHHKVQYYETDQMGVVHHSNYIRWFEEARIHCLDHLGVSYAALEQRGIRSPVLSAQCQYQSMTRFGETVRIETRLSQVQQVRYGLCYAVYDKQTGALRATGETLHCFIDRQDRVVSLKKLDPELFAAFRAAVD